MKKSFLLTLLSLLPGVALWCQPKYDLSKMVTEKLDRGVVAVRHEGATMVSWRTLSTDRKGEPFDVYRDGEKLNAEPLVKGGTLFTDSTSDLGHDVVYEVRGGGVDGRFVLRADAPIGYLPVKIERPDGGKVPTMQASSASGPQPGRGRGRRWGWRDDGTYTYSANDVSVGDVDGDGQYELFVKWEPSNARDNSHDGYTGPTIIDCYQLEIKGIEGSKEAVGAGSRLLWRINLGQNIRSGAHYTPFMVYDFDGDGRAELMVKTADGTRDGQGRVIGDSLADYRNPAGRILTGPEYITVFNGLSGAAMDTKPYIPERGNVSDWGDDRGNRSERYLAALGYLGHKVINVNGSKHQGKKRKGRSSKEVASALFCRGYYTRTVIAAWDWDGHELTNRWTFDTDETPWKDYAGQGNHNLRVADVDGDGFDEITYGSMAVDHDGRGLYNTGFGHGDAIHLLAEPHTNRLFIWDCHENRRDGSDLRDACTGEVVFQVKSTTDVGRAMAADIDPTNPGMEMWSTDSHGIRSMKGGVVSTAKDADDPQHDNTLVLNGRYLPVNYGIWWDGDLLRELLDRETVTKYNWKDKSIDTIWKFEGVAFNNGTKSNPCLSADILGDWREEVIARDRESAELRIYVSPEPTDYRMDCLMHDVPYRLSVATQNVGYNQPSEPGFYLGPDDESFLK